MLGDLLEKLRRINDLPGTLQNRLPRLNSGRGLQTSPRLFAPMFGSKLWVQG
jgi:hypothetical protein